MATCHPDRPHRAKGLCGSCYIRSRPEYGLRRIPRSVIAQLLEAQGYRCRYCDRPLALREATADHIIPRLDGGSDDLANLAAACQSCNSRKWANEPPPGITGHRGPAMKPSHVRRAALDAGDLTLAEAAVELGVAASTLRHQAQAGRLEARRLGKTWITTRQEVERYRRESLGKPGRPTRD